MRAAATPLAWICATVALLATAARTASAEPRLDVHTSSLLQHRLGEWSTLDIRASNPTDQPVEAMVVVFFEGEPWQYGRRLWVPAKGDRTTWLPIRLPAKETNEGGLNYTTLILDADSDREILSRRDGDPLSETSLLRLSSDPVRSMFIPPRPLLSPTPAEEAIRVDWPRALAAARFSRGLNTTSPQLTPDFLPPWPMVHRGVDVLLLATDQLESDTAGLAALRGWVRDGGRLWIALDAVGPETVKAILGNDAGIEVVDRVEIDSFKMEGLDRTSDMNSADDFDFEQPVEMVRVITTHADVPARVDGWPAAIWVPCGQGDVLITTLGPRAWVGSDGVSPTGAARVLAARLLAGRPGRLDVDRMRPALDQQIGYATPSRGIAATILGLFCAAILGAGMVWASRQRLDHLAWFVPTASLAAAGLLGLLGLSSSRTVPPTIASASILRVDPATGEALIDGSAAVYDQQSRAVAWTGRRHTWAIPDTTQGTNGQRLVWFDDGLESSQNTSTHAGSVDRLSIQGSTTILPGPAVHGRFGPRGLEGTIDAGPLTGLVDPAVVGMPGPALAVELAADGSFRADADGLMAPGQYNPAPLLADDAQWRQEATRRLLQSSEGVLRDGGRQRGGPPEGIDGNLALRRRPWLLFWCDSPAEQGWDAPEGFALRTSTMALSPLHLSRPAAGERFTIPANFLPGRLGEGKQGRSNAFDPRRGEWVKGLTTPTETVLRFPLPDCVIPCRLDSGTLSIRINAPSRHLTVSSLRDGRPFALLDVPDPNGVYRIDLAADDLELDDGSAVPITISVSATTAEKEAEATGAEDAFSTTMSNTAVSSTWEIDHVRLTVEGQTR